MRPHFSDLATVACDYDCLVDDRLTNQSVDIILGLLPNAHHDIHLNS
jgi:hypothetical protein